MERSYTFSFEAITQDQVAYGDNCDHGKLLKCAIYYHNKDCKHHCRSVSTLDEALSADKQMLISFPSEYISVDVDVNAATRECNLECWKDCEHCYYQSNTVHRLNATLFVLFDLLFIISSCILANFIISKNIEPIDCEWGSWGEYTKCSNSCGRGKKTRTRTVVKAARYGGKCSGKRTETAMCNNANPSLCQGTKGFDFNLK